MTTKNKAAIEMAKLSKKKRHQGKTKAQISQMYRDIAKKRVYKRQVAALSTV